MLKNSTLGDSVLLKGQSLPENDLRYKISSLGSMCICGAYFNLAMHETESQLEKLNADLIISEKKAVIGKLATEMAHEIQNPMNFVNNFSQINQELLDEIKEISEKEGSSKESLELIEQVRENNRRIEMNGKKISVIVHQLQDEIRLGIITPAKA
jgi:signal transduction histidine kinase